MSSLLPFLYELDRSRRMANQYAMLTPEEIFALYIPTRSNEALRNWSNLSSLRDANKESTIKTDNNKFQVNLDVQHFAPEEISVKTVEGFVVIEAKHDEKKDDHGWVTRQFVRRYPLPEGCNAEAVQSRLSSDGVLSITAPLQRPQASNERLVPIVQTGPVKTRLEGTKFEGEGDVAVANLPLENGQ